ncbi:RICIN domain-containing protein [Paenibacillus wuxiensis]|uniref:RICIN domain-containing protein n=1 Tax=Paenibacillaceae bacterium P-4 TaxID=3160969 RepID=UPI00406B9AB1
MVNEMDFNLRNRTYSEQLWVNVTGHTVDQLWQQYSKDPNLTNNDVLVGRPYKLINVNSGKALDVQGSGAANGTNVQIYSDNGSAAQRWTVYRNQDGTYKLINAVSAKALDVTSSGTGDGTNVQIWDDNGSGAQKWSFIRNTDGSYKLINSNSNKVLDVSSSGTNDGTNVQIWTDNGTAAQKWKLVLLN